jgi:uncharacterized SAM-binding protein YcdF (DUF218 family)
MIRVLLKSLIQPPACCFLLGALGALSRRRAPRLGRFLVVAAVGGLYLASTPLVAALLLRSLEMPPLALDRPGDGVRAIVVLSGDGSPGPEYGGPTVGATTLERLRYAAWLYRRTSLPILVSGGSLRPDRPPIALRMKSILEEEFSVPVRWVEERSRNTAENARFSAEILSREGIHRVYVVTHASHMPRAVRAFARAGVEGVAAPTAFADPLGEGAVALVPSARALRDSATAVTEWAGSLWYALTGG